MNSRILVSALLALLLLPAAAAAKPRTVNVQLLAINDFHGHLESTTPGTIAPSPDAERVPAGGAEYLATHIRRKERHVRNSLVVAAGDLIGASPLLSALFHDEPTIETMNRIGLDIASVGNHEFDEGSKELLRMQEGGCHPTDGCQDHTKFKGANFRYLSANVVRHKSGKTLFRPWTIRKFRGIKLGFIGMTLQGTPDIVSPSGVAGLRFLDEARTANRYARILRRRHGVRAIVVLLHQGGSQAATGGIKDCDGM